MVQAVFSKKNIILLILLGSIQLFSLIVFPRSALAGIEAAGSFALIFIYIVYQVYTDDSFEPVKKGFRVEVNLMILAVILSMPIATIYHDQNILITAFGQKFTYYLLFYYLLHFTGTDSRYIEKVIFVFGAIWCILFLAQYFVYPFRILNSRVDLDRGTVRIFFPGNTLAAIAYFISLQRSFSGKLKIRYVIYILVFFSITGFLQGTRSNLGGIMLLTGLYLILGRNVRSRMMIIILAGLVGIGSFFLFSEVITEMITLSEKQTSIPAYEKPIRVQSIEFFLGEFMPGKIAYIFGNGADHGRSPYGKKIIYYKIFHGFYQSDIGLIGEYSKFGLLFVLAEILIFIRGIFGKMPRNISYVRYVFAYIFLTSIVGAGAYTSSSMIVSNMFLIYIIDYDRFWQERKEDSG